MSPRRNNPDNGPKQTNHNQDPSNPNVHRDQDPAAPLVDPLRALYRYADSDQQREALFQPDGFDGAYDLLEVANDVRQSGGRQLDEGEQLLARYVDIQAQNVVLSSGINFAALEEDYTTKDGTKLSYEDAAVTRISNVIRSLKGKIDRSSDDDEKERLNEQRKSLYAYRKLYQDGEMTEPGSLSAGREFMAAWREARNDSSQEKQQAIQKAAIQLNKSVDTFAVQMKAFQAILEHGRKEYLQTPSPVSDDDIDPRLRYVDVSDTNAQDTTDQQGNNGGDSGNGGNGANQSAKGSPERASHPAIDDIEEELDEVRKALALEKSKIFRYTKLGRAVVRIANRSRVLRGFAGNPEKDNELEERYHRLVNLKFEIKNESYLNDPSVGSDRKNAKIAKAIVDEQEELRKETTEQMRSKRIAKVCRWLTENKKRQGLMYAFVLGAAPWTGLVSLSIAAGIHAAAVHDKKTRGMRKTREMMNVDEVRRFIEANTQEPDKESQKPKDAQEAMRQRIEFLRIKFNYAQILSMKRFNDDIERERRKRYLSAAIGSVAMYSVNAGLSTLDTISNPVEQGWDRTWNDIVDWSKERVGTMFTLK